MANGVRESGIKILSQPPEGEESSVLADIVFVHGLFGGWTETWTQRNPGGTSVFWPQDLLPSDFPNLRIITYGYDADVAKIGEPAAQNSLHQNASNLLMCLAMERQQTRSETRPIIFVCHSLGGLLVEDALVTSSNKAYMRYDDIANSTVGIIFMGTPHFGSDAANYADIIGAVISILAPWKQVNRKLLKVLQKQSEVLKNTQTMFCDWIQTRRVRDDVSVNIINFFESYPYVAGKIEIMVVRDDSATMGIGENVPLSADHVSIVKFGGKADAKYAAVRGTLSNWLGYLSGDLDIQVADRRGVYDDEIERLRLAVFVGRKELLQEVHAQLKSLPLNDRSLVLQGLGGVGKTQTAIKYAREQYFEKSTCKTIFWLDASTESSIIASYAHIARLLDPATEGLKDDQKVGYVKRYLNRKRTRWLIVLDNLDNPALFGARIRQYMPRGKLANILITSRHRDTNRLGSVLHVHGMKDDDAMELLFRSSKQPGRLSDLSVEDKAYYLKVVRKLGSLPLAIDQAGAFINAQGISVRGFLDEFQENRRDILEYCPQVWFYAKKLDAAHPEVETYLSCFSSWELSFQVIGRGDIPPSMKDVSSETAKVSKKRLELHEMTAPANLLILSAFFPRQQLSEFIFHRSATASGSHAPTWLRDNCLRSGKWHSGSFRNMIQRFGQFSMTESAGDNEKLRPKQFEYTLHPLVQEWAQLRLSDQERANFRLMTQWMVFDVLSFGNLDDEICQNKDVVLAHLDECLRNDDAAAADHSDGERLLGSRELAEVSLRFASFYTEHARYTEPRKLYRQILSRHSVGAGQSVDENDYMHLMSAKEGLAILDLAEGDYERAESQLREVVDSYANHLGKTSLDYLRAIVNLAEALGGQEKYDDVTEMWEEILDGYERSPLGPTHHITTLMVEGVSNAYRVAGQFDQAVKYGERALRQIDALGLGKNHPDVLALIGSCASAFKDRGDSKKGDFEKAETLFQRALEGYKASLGKAHPTTFSICENFGDLWAAKGEFDRAKECYTEVWHGRTDMFGQGHCDTKRAYERLKELETTKEKAINHRNFYCPWPILDSTFTESLGEEKEATMERSRRRPRNNFTVTIR